MSDSICRSVVQPIARRLTAAGSGGAVFTHIGATFDGVGDYVSFPAFPLLSGEIEIAFVFDGTSGDLLASNRDELPYADDSKIKINSSTDIRVKRYGNTATFNSGFELVTGFNTIRIVITLTSVTLFVNDVEIGTQNVADNGSGAEINLIAARIQTGGTIDEAFGSTIQRLAIDGHLEYDFRDDNGLIIHDRSGNANNGTLTVNSSLEEIFAQL
jgi:hypothetical protein